MKTNATEKFGSVTVIGPSPVKATVFNTYPITRI